MSDLDDLLKRLEELHKSSSEAIKRFSSMDEHKPLQGEPGISEELKNAVSMLAKTKYRGLDRWKVVVTYRFTEDGITVRTSVKDDSGSYPIDFTEAEAVLIAATLASKQQEEEGG